MGQLAHGCWNARVPRGGPDVPILPSVIPATGHALTLCECSGGANRTRSSVGPVLAEAHHLRTWNQPSQAFGQFHLQRMRQREAMPTCQLFRHRPIHFFMRISQNIGQKSLYVIDIFIAIDIPDTATLAAIQEYRSNSLHILRVALAESLRAAGDNFFRAR